MLCSDENIHKNERVHYEQLLKRDGYGRVVLNYKTPETEEERAERIRKREINRLKARQVSWFNPPYSRQVESGKSVGKAFFSALDSCFPIGHPLHKIFNRNTVNLSYPMMPNLGMLIKGKNKRILEDHIRSEHEKDEIKKQGEEKKTRGRPKTIIRKDCTCQRNKPCPLEGNCNVTDVVYQATILLEDSTSKYYVGQAKDFKERYRNHLATFRNKNIAQICNLKDYIWELKESGLVFTLSWKILRKSKAYKPGDRCCLLCLDEKLSILDVFKDPDNINKDLMIQRPCLHRHAYRIS